MATLSSDGSLRLYTIEQEPRLQLRHDLGKGHSGIDRTLQPFRWGVHTSMASFTSCAALFARPSPAASQAELIAASKAHGGIKPAPGLSLPHDGSGILARIQMALATAVTLNAACSCSPDCRHLAFAHRKMLHILRPPNWACSSSAGAAVRPAYSLSESLLRQVAASSTQTCACSPDCQHLAFAHREMLHILRPPKWAHAARVPGLQYGQPPTVGVQWASDGLRLIIRLESGTIGANQAVSFLVEFVR